MAVILFDVFDKDNLNKLNKYISYNRQYCMSSQSIFTWYIISDCKFAMFQVLGHPRWSTQKWSVESVHSKNLVAILHLLVALARHFRAPVRLPENVAVAVVVVQVNIINC